MYYLTAASLAKKLMPKVRVI